MNEKIINRWFIVAGAVMIQLCLGALYAWSLFNTPLIQANPGWDLASVALIFSITIAAMCIGSIIGGKAQDRFNPRWVGTAGGVLFGTGVMLAGYATELWQLYLFYGIIGGLGCGTVYVIPIATCVKWFPDKRGLISGIAVAGFGAGAMVFKPLIIYLIASQGVHESFFFLGIIYLIAVVAGSQLMIVPPAGYKPEGYEPQAGTGIAGTNFTTGEMFRTKQFYIIWSMFLFGCLAGLMIIGLAANIGTGLVNLDSAAAANTVVIIAVFNSAGRIAWGSISDKFGRLPAITAMFIIASMAMFLMGYIPLGHLTFVILCSAVGFCFGGFLATFPTVTAEYFGTRNFGMNYSMILLAYGTAAIIGPRLATTFEFTEAFFIASALCLAAALMTFTARKPAQPLS